jgi:hypothetical protein
VNNGARSVDTVVMVIESARLAFAMYDITLEAIPAGEHPIRIIPAAISGEKGKILANKNPNEGIIIK